jgi:uncharacterized protein (DUF2147 family)
MKRFAVTLVLGLVLMASVAAQNVTGLWKSIDEEGEITAIWELRLVDGEVRGRVVTIAGKPNDTIAVQLDQTYPGLPSDQALNTMRVVDIDLIYGMTPRRGRAAQYTGGYIIDPNDGKRYNLDLNVIPAGSRNSVGGLETLEVKGKILIFSRSQYWVRATQEDVIALR